ncbi:hypothetical protein [Pseudomonas hefeiensis]|uniref:Crocagin biosynthetic protein CgnE/B domain-containing protein n=1 Tax=Pseudomonas hefeiensis TaxID=2738125 RepID=A0ABY9GC74_9PSED|nr:hypothetical protein [Pseudomonas sp. FP205]WLH13173.1 hypothetical protein PSH57_02090 [Pseudomonas sp. FP205]
MSSMSNIHTLFGPEDFWILADSHKFLNACGNQGLNILHLSETETLPRNSIIFSFSDSAAKRTLEIAKATPEKRSIFCATQVFEPSHHCANYSLNLLLNSDFEKALKRQRFILNMLNSHNSFSIRGKGSCGHLTLNPQAKPYALIDEDISNNFIYSVAEFFEVHYAHITPQAPCPFNFNGKLRISGLLTVLRRANPLLPENIKSRLQQLSNTVAKGGGLLTIEENKITSLQVGNSEHIETLKLASGIRGIELTEFAIGVNEEIAPLIDYKVNSQLNEGIDGIHLAIGDGSSGFHIDFLSPAVRVTPIV